MVVRHTEALCPYDLAANDNQVIRPLGDSLFFLRVTLGPAGRLGDNP
jgi:hypothetical protein